jgi:transcriptional regulator
MSTTRRQLTDLLSNEPRSASSLARQLGLRRAAIEDDLQHAVRSAAAAGHRLQIIPARCKDCGFEFDATRLSKPGRCPSCRGSRLFEPLIRLAGVEK